MNSQAPVRRLLIVIAVLLAGNLALGLARTFSAPAGAQAREGVKLVGIATDPKYIYRAWSDGRVDACYYKWSGDQDPAAHPNRWIPQDAGRQ